MIGQPSGKLGGVSTFSLVTPNHAEALPVLRSVGCLTIRKTIMEVDNG